MKEKNVDLILDMLVEENPPCSNSLVLHLIVVGFHHKKGHQVGN
jgi:hypothetical protein